MDSTKQTISVLDYLLKHTDEPIYRHALTAARNRMLRDVDSSAAARRSVSDWPCCAKCGMPYGWQATNDDYVHALSPTCGCGADAMMHPARPNGTWNEVRA